MAKEKSERTDRLGEALRANLRKRKALAKARQAPSAAGDTAVEVPQGADRDERSGTTKDPTKLRAPVTKQG